MVNALHFLRPSCPSAIAEKRTTQKSQGGRSARMKNSGVHPRNKNKAGGRCVRAMVRDTARAPRQKKTPPPWEPGRFQARPSRGSNPSFDRRQFLGEKNMFWEGPKTTVSPRVPAAHFSRGSPPPLARKLLRRLLRRLGGFCEGFSEGRRARSCPKLLRRQEGSRGRAEASEKASQKAGRLPRGAAGSHSVALDFLTPRARRETIVSLLAPAPRSAGEKHGS